MNLKEIAKSFLTMASSGDVQNAYEEFVSNSFIHHNQYFEGDRQSLLDAMADASKTSPNLSFEIKHMYQEDQTVISHAHVVKENMEIAVVHIFRFEEEKIIELWDLGQVIDKNSPNKNGLF